MKEQLGDFIYSSLKEIEKEFDTKITERALIADKLSVVLINWIRSHQLISPDADSLTRFYPYYMIKEKEL